jgi:predicted Mrr-cat superfamily restriction endonuclease
MQNIWLHRISHCAEVSYPLLKKGYLSIGWSDFSTPEFIEEVCGENGWQNFEKHLEDWGYPRNRYNFWRFIADMKKGDWVVVPSWGTFSIFEIEEDKALSIPEIVQLVKIKDWSDYSVEIGENDCLYNTGVKDEKGNNVLIDLGFFRKVKPIATEISRYEYADAALTARMKIRQTNADITDLKDSVEKALTAYQQNKPLSIYFQLVEKASPQFLNTIQSELTPDKFEYLVKWYFERIGATNVYIPSKNESGKEGDADVIATFESIKTIIYTQVKFYSGETSSWAIEQIIGYKSQKDGIDDGYSKIAWVISSSDNFSEEAKNKAKAANIQLFSGIQFATMLLEAGIANLNGTI